MRWYWMNDKEPDENGDIELRIVNNENERVSGFKGKTVDEILEKIADSQVFANLRIAELQKPDKSGREPVQTYYGQQMLHEYLERTTWHVGQHVRQWVMLLDMAGISADRPPSGADFADLPMPSQVWDG